MDAIQTFNTAATYTAQNELKQNTPKEQGADYQQNQVRKEEQMVKQLAQQNNLNQAASAQTVQLEAVSNHQLGKESRTASQVDTSRPPNWSLLSAQAKGYTQLQRAMNLYQHINRLG